METSQVYGIHAANKCIQHHADRILSAHISDSDSSRLKTLVDQLQELGVNINSLKRDKLTELAKSPQHQGILLTIKSLPVGNENDLFDRIEQRPEGFFLVLDTVEDPRNMGACIRTAESMGALGVVAPKDKSASVTPVVRKVACGAAEILPIFQVTNLARTLTTMQDYGYWIYGTGWGEKSQDLYATEFPKHFAVVMGSEGKGLRQLTVKTCDQLITIPMPGLTESLNVSVATGIVCGEIVRQKLAVKS